MFVGIATGRPKRRFPHRSGFIRTIRRLYDFKKTTGAGLDHFIQKLKETFLNNYNYSFSLEDNLSDHHRFDEALNIDYTIGA
jgi:hypothetical protein